MTVRIDGTNSTANPAITGADTDTGLQFGTNEVKVVTDGTDRVTVDSSGNVGIGTTSPDQLLHLSSSGNPTLVITSTNDSFSNIYFADSSGVAGRIEYQHSNNSMQFRTGNTERLRISSDGTIQLRNSPGIDFSQIQTNVAGMTSETLDSYEEGTWTPSISSSGGGLVATVSNTTGYYTKIGDVVHAWWYSSTMNITNNGTGSARVTGLPFNSAALTHNYGVVSTTHNTAFASATDSGYVATNNDQIVFQPTGSTASSNWAQANGIYLMILATYKAA